MPLIKKLYFNLQNNIMKIIRRTNNFGWYNIFIEYREIVRYQLKGLKYNSLEKGVWMVNIIQVLHEEGV